VLEGKVTVDPGQKPLHPDHPQVGLQGVPAPCRRNRPVGVTLVHLRPDPLRRPQQEAQLVQGQLLMGVDAPALAVPDRLHQVDARDVPPLAELGQVDPHSLRGKRLLDRRRGNTAVLVGPGKVHLLPDAVLQEIPELLDEFPVHAVSPSPETRNTATSASPG